MYKQNKIRKETEVRVSNIQEVINNKLIRNSTPFTITSEGEGFYRVNGQLIPMKEFEALYPIEIISTSNKGKDIDGRRNWQ